MTVCCASACDVTLDGGATITIEVGDTLNQRLLELIAALKDLADVKVMHEVETGGVLDTFLTNYLADCCP